MRMSKETVMATKSVTVKNCAFSIHPERQLDTFYSSSKTFPPWHGPGQQFRG